MILWGPRRRKNNFAEIIANELDRPFYSLSAISSGVKDIRNIIESVKTKEFLEMEMHYYLLMKSTALVNLSKTHFFQQ